ncbi:MAG: DUF4147 domain-containing protein [Patescibacteria group bacterium]
MKIKNSDKLARTELRRAALQIAEAGLEAIDTQRVIRENIRLEGEMLFVKNEQFSLQGVKRLAVAGAGKCAAEAASALEKILGDRLSGGVILDIGELPKLKKISCYRGTHPLPSEENMKGTAALIQFLTDLNEDDFVIFIITGGGSTLLCAPEDKGCAEEGVIVKTLTAAGATIEELNTVRKHLSFARGGYLAQYIYPARAVSRIFSDVPHNDIEFIASGPTVKDITTVEQAEEVLAKYHVLQTCGIERCGIIETPKEEKYFEHIKNVIIVSNQTALEAMRRQAESLGFRAKISDVSLTGEAREAGLKIAHELHNAPSKAALLYGGETTVTLKHEGKGGRNMELALSALRAISPGELLITLASDGRDNTEFAGGICDILTKEKAAHAGLDPETYLEENRSYDFWKATGEYVLTGDTGSNVSDLVITIKE